jgi:hypothetical protein
LLFPEKAPHLIGKGILFGVMYQDKGPLEEQGRTIEESQEVDTELVGERRVEEHILERALFGEPKVPFYGHNMEGSLSLQEGEIAKESGPFPRILLYEHHPTSSPGVRFDTDDSRATEQVQERSSCQSRLQNGEDRFPHAVHRGSKFTRWELDLSAFEESPCDTHTLREPPPQKCS